MNILYNILDEVTLAILFCLRFMETSAISQVLGGSHQLLECASWGAR